MAYEINYNDERFTKVESDKQEALSELEETYAGMINDSDKYYQAQIDASKQWADKQAQLQQEQTDFAIDKIEQQKAQEKKDYIKEQSGAYVDWRRQSNEYGSEAEKMAAQGLQNTGYSESSQVSMYNTYQNRVATAREAYNLAIQNYNNSIQEARLQNNSILAEIAYNALQQQLELSLQGFQYKNTLLLAKADKKTEIENNYYNRYQDVLDQINTENALAEEIRQYNASLAEERRQFNETMAFNKEQFAWQKAQAKKSSSSSGGSSKKSSSSSGKSGSSSGSSSVTKTNTEQTGIPSKTKESILALGYGPISASALAKKVASGEVIEYTRGGVTLYKKASKKTTTGSSSGTSRSSLGNLLK